MTLFCTFYNVEMPKLKIGYCPYNLGTQSNKAGESRKLVCPAGRKSFLDSPQPCPYGFKSRQKNTGEVKATYIGKGKKKCPFYGVELPSKIGYCPLGASFPETFKFEKGLCPFGYKAQSEEASTKNACPFGYPNK